MTNRIVSWFCFVTGVACIAVFSTGCSTAQRVEHVETQLDTKGVLAGEKIGIDPKGQAIVQEETAADIELRNIRWRTYDLEKLIASDYERLEKCRNDLADPRLGGSGQVTEIPEIDTAKDTSKVKEELGLTEDQSLKVVRKELYVDRLMQERKYETSLAALSKAVEKHRKTCDREWSFARVKHGLPAGRIMGTGHYTANGDWVSETPTEHSLDDAFKMTAQRSNNE